MRKSIWKKTLLIISIGTSGCGTVPVIHPHVLDTQLKEMREYEIVDPENALVEFKEAHPIENWGHNAYGNGFWCVPPQEAVALKEWYLNNKTKQSKP